jgi:hypothetical protein
MQHPDPEHQGMVPPPRPRLSAKAGILSALLLVLALCLLLLNCRLEANCDVSAAVLTGAYDLDSTLQLARSPSWFVSDTDKLKASASQVTWSCPQPHAVCTVTNSSASCTSDSGTNNVTDSQYGVRVTCSGAMAADGSCSNPQPLNVGLTTYLPDLSPVPGNPFPVDPVPATYQMFPLFTGPSQSVIRGEAGPTLTTKLVVSDMSTQNVDEPAAFTGSASERHWQFEEPDTNPWTENFSPNLNVVELRAINNGGPTHFCGVKIGIQLCSSICDNTGCRVDVPGCLGPNRPLTPAYSLASPQGHLLWTLVFDGCTGAPEPDRNSPTGIRFTLKKVR